MTAGGAPAPPVRGRWWERRTLRFRVVASLLAVVLAAFVVVGLVTGIALNRFLVGRLDQQISDAGTRYVAAQAEHSAPAGGFGDARGQAVGTLGARVAGGRLVRIGVVGRSAAAQLTPQQLRQITTLPVGHSRSADLGQYGDYRLRAFSVDEGKVVVGLPLNPVHDTLDDLLVVELVVFGAVLACIATAGRWLVGLSLRPLERVTGTARRVAETPLSEEEVELAARAPVVDSSTEVGQLGHAFNRMLDHVEASLRTRRDTEERLRRFIADASHELRTPVAAIRGHAESVRHVPEEMPPSVAEAMRRIESEATRMGVLVDDLLLLARLDAGRSLARERVDVTRIVLDATVDARAAGPDHRWLLNLPEDPVILHGDDHRLRELVTNLLTNARVHTPPATTVEVVLTGEPDVTVLTVTDDGPGIPVAAQPRVFERFYRGDGVRAPQTGSSGLGLAIVAAVARAHGGDVTVASRPGRTTFSLRLPAA